jgi:hypothetical protein
MPVILETIDAIARRLKRDVIFLAIVERQDRPSRDRPEVAEATDWLDTQGLGWSPCFGFLPGLVIFEGGPRAIHIDAPFEPGSPPAAQAGGPVRDPGRAAAPPGPRSLPPAAGDGDGQRGPG